MISEDHDNHNNQRSNFAAMIYRAIGLMSGSSLDGLDIVFTELNEERGQWSFGIQSAACYEYSTEWKERLQNAISLNALDYQLLHAEYGHYLGREVKPFLLNPTICITRLD